MIGPDVLQEFRDTVYDAAFEALRMCGLLEWEARCGAAEVRDAAVKKLRDEAPKDSDPYEERP